mgnify:CR=1 FL=1
MADRGYLRYVYAFDKHPEKKVDKINVSIRNNDTKGKMYITDIQLQEGKMLTGWVPNTEEILERRRDEDGNIEPTKYFNALVRGEANIIVPRVLEYKKIIKKGEIVTAEASRHILRKNGNPIPSTDYKGPQITAPAGDILYKVKTHERDAIRFVFKITEWNVRKGATW